MTRIRDNAALLKADLEPESSFGKMIAPSATDDAKNSDANRLPDYMTEVYQWAYIDPKHVRFLDQDWVVEFLLFFNARRLIKQYLDRIVPGMRVWQVAHVYGRLIRQAAERVGANGAFYLSDITPIQAGRSLVKLAGMSNSNVWLADAASFCPPQSPDLICSFFLLHEVPDDKKRAIVDNILDQLPAHGEALFIDYHRPARWQPAGWILKCVNRWLEPFAASLWQHEISHFASRPQQYTWKKQTQFGGVYQIVSVKKTATLDALDK